MTALSAIEETFSLLDGWEDRYAYLIELGHALPPFPEDGMTDERLVPGCTSKVWMIVDISDDGRMHIRATSDAHIVRGLIAIVIAAYDGLTAEEVGAVDIKGVFDRLGLSGHLSPSRRNGFFAMVGRIRAYRPDS